MSTPEGPSPPEDTGNLNYSRGDPVRVYVDRDGEPRAEDDWEYRSYREDIDHEVAAKQRNEGGATEFVETPKAMFDAWQLELMTDIGRVSLEETLEVPSNSEAIVNDDNLFIENDGAAIWHSSGGDIPVKVIGSLGFGEDGKEYLRIEGSDTGVPRDEVESAEKLTIPDSDIQSRSDSLTNPDKFSGLRKSHFGGWGEDGKYRFAYEPARIAERTHIPLDVLVAAAERGISPEYLNQARNNEAAGRHLREIGIGWGAAPAPEAADDVHFREVSEEDLKVGSKISGKDVTQSYVELAKTEYLRGNEFPAEYLATIGIPILDQRLEPPDPIMLANAVGRNRRRAVVELSENIEKNPGEISRSLRRPASLPLPSGFYESSVLRFAITDRLNSLIAPVGKRLLAWKVARKEIKERPHVLQELTKEYERLEELGEARTATERADMSELKDRISYLSTKQKSDLGLLRIGLPVYRETHDYIDNLDESVGSHRRQLSLLQRHKLHNINTAILNLSYRVFDASESLRVLREKHAINDYEDPYFIHNHERFKKQRSAFVNTYIRDNRV